MRQTPTNTSHQGHQPQAKSDSSHDFPEKTFNFGSKEAVVVWVLRDLSFSLVVFVLPEPLSKWLISKGIKEVKGVPIQEMPLMKLWKSARSQP